MMPVEGWKHATNAGMFNQGKVFGWVENGKLWSGIVTEVDFNSLRVKVKNILPGVIQNAKR